MASKEELSEQLAVTQKLAAAVELMSKHMARVESSYDTQITSVEKLTRAIETLRGQDLGELNNAKLDPIQKEFKETEKNVTSLSGRIKEIGGRFAKKFPTELGVGAAALGGLQQGIRNTLALGKGVAGFFASFTEGAVSLTASIIAIPFKMFSSLVDMAAAAGGGMNELAVALENLRKEMGDLKGPGTHAVLVASKSLKGFSDTGLSAWRVFGTLAERIELVTKLAVGMGSTFGILRKEFEDNGGALLAYQKGLGLSEEGMKAFGDRSITMGVPLSKTLLDITKQTISLGKAFDIDQKLIGKDMQKAALDVKHFGAVTVKEIGQASVYARKLGLELDKITGTLDAFETFDTAAENAAKLSQAFGVNIDAFQMMEAQNPAEQLDMLRKSFREAGVDASQFTRQQAKLLAQSSGLDEATVRQAFSTKNYGVSLDDVKKKSENAEKKTMSQADAMSKLADSIERMVKSGGAQSGGFWEMFVKGFLGGIQSSKEFREIIWNIKKSLQLVYMEGVRLGKMFVDIFPGVKQFLGGIADFFRPAKFKTLVKGVVDVIIGWMKDLTDPNGKASFAGLMDKLREKFFGFFDSSESSGKKMLDGFKTTFKTIGKVVAEGIKWAADKAGEGISFIIDLIIGKKKLGGSAALGGALGFLWEVIEPLGDALVHAWTVIAPKLWELVTIVAKKLYDYLTSPEFYAIVKPALPYLAAALFGPAAVSALAGGFTTLIGKAAMKAFSGSDSKSVMEDVAKKAASETAKAFTKAPKSEGEGGIPGAVQKGGQLIEKTKDWGAKDAVALGLKLVALAAALAVGGYLLSIAFVEMKKVLDAGGIKDLKSAEGPMIVLAAMALASIPVMLAMKLADKSASLSEILKGGATIVAAVTVVGGVGALLAWVMSKAGSPAQLSSAGDLMLKMSVVFLTMVPLLVAATVIGALVTASGGTALIAAAAGMTVIASAVAVMAKISADIVTQLNGLQIESGFQQKVDAFLGVMKSIQSLADTLVSVIGLMSPTFVELIAGAPTASFGDKVNSATKLIGEMVGEKGGGKGIIGIVELVMDMIQKLKPASGLSEGAKLFADVLTAVAAVTKAMTPPPEYFDAQTSLVNVLDPTIGKGLDQTVKGYMQEMTGGLTNIIMQVKSSVEMMAKIDVPSPEKAQAVASLLQSVVGLLKNLTPSPETVNAFSSEVMESKALWGLVQEKVKKFDGAALATTIKTMGDQLSALLPVLVDSVLTKITSTTLTPAQVENVKSMAPIMAAVSDIASSIAGLAKGKKVTPVEIAGATAFAIEEVPDLEALFKGIGSSLPGLVKAVIDAVSGIKVGSNFAALAKTAEQIFGFLNMVIKLPGEITQQTTTITGNIGEGLAKPIGYVAELLDWLLMSKNGKPPVLKEISEQLNSPIFQQLGNVKTGGLKAAKDLSGLLTSMSEITKSVTSMSNADTGTIDNMKIAQVMGNMSSVIDALKSTLPDVVSSLTGVTGLGTAANSFKQFGVDTQKIADVIKSGGIRPALEAVTEMIDLTNKLNTQLSNLPEIGPIKTKLGAIANAVGLGGKASYKVNAAEVNINVQVHVTMNAGDVEKVIIERANSSIRQRLDTLTENAETKMSPLIMPSGTSYAGPTPALSKTE